MTDLLLYFALTFLASCLVLAGLAWLTRPAKAESPKEYTPDYANKPFADWARREMASDLTLARRYLLNAPCRLEKVDNEDTRPMPASRHDDIVDSFDYEELWEAAAQIPRESEELKAQINSWEAQAFKDAGEDYEL